MTDDSISAGKDINSSSIILGSGNTINVNGPPTPRPSGPLFSIPAPPENFTGRTDEIADLLANFANGVAISGLSGGGGVGKSALARVLAEKLADQFPDGRIQLDLQGAPHSRETPLTSVDGLRRILQAFHPTAQLPDDENALKAILTDTLRGKRVLLLLDNARDAAQVRPLLPPAPSAAIVTSRTRIILKEKGLYAKTIGSLPPAEARALLRKTAQSLVSADDASVDALAQQCGALPLALNVAASLLESRRDWTPAHLIERLADERARLSLLKMDGDPDLDVEASLSLSYNQLDGAQQRQFRTLGIFPAPFDQPAAAYLWDTPANQCDDALGLFLRLSLLEHRPGESMPYRLHDLTRIYAEDRLREQADEWASAAQRHAEYYLQLGWDNNELYKQGHEHVLESLRAFDLLWPHLRAAYERNLQNAGNTQADDWLNKFPGRVVYTLDLRLTPRQQIPLLQSALAAARRLHDQSREGIHLGNLGLAYYNLGETRRAIEYHEQALVIDREIGNRHGEGQDLGNLGLAYYNLGETRRAIELHEQSLVVKREIGNRRGEGNSLGNLGLAYADLGELRRAIEYYEQALVINREIGDRRGEGNALGNLGLAYYNLGETRRAIEYHEQNVVIAREIGDRRGEGGALGNLGIAYKKLGEMDKALAHYQQQQAITREIGHKTGEANACWNMGVLLEEQGQFQHAAALMQVLLDFYTALGHPEAAALAQQVEEVRRKASS